MNLRTSIESSLFILFKKRFACSSLLTNMQKAFSSEFSNMFQV